MSFADDLRRWTIKTEAMTKAVFVGTVEEATRSVVFGSEITGAPGQPVDSGNLRDSWQTIYDTPTSAQIVTNVEYAPYVEDNVRGVTFRNHGAHSVKLTIAGMPKIVETVVKRTAA